MNQSFPTKTTTPPPERWRPVPDYETLYSVSSDGQVRRELTRTSGKQGTLKTVGPDSAGFQCVCLSRPNDRGRQIAVHRLVWKAFRGPIPINKIIVHIDGNRLDNSLANLKEVPRGSLARRNVPNAKAKNEKLDDKDVENIRLDRAGGLTIRQLATNYGVSIVHARNVVLGRAWKNRGGPITRPRYRPNGVA